jgi:HPt (histidine-containing phosphotransfer) domain-containing protein
MTANAMSEARETYLAVGMNDYVSKPVDAKLLLSKLSRLRAKPKLPTPAALAVAVLQDESAAEAIPLLDLDKLASLESILPFSKVAALVALFLSDLDSRVLRIGSYKSAGSRGDVAREAHIIVSTAGNLGAMQMSALARSLENACRENQFERVEPRVDELSVAAAAVRAKFEFWVNERRMAMTDGAAGHSA